jgi:hypothetical protein
MAAALSVTPSGQGDALIKSTKTTVRIDVTGADANRGPSKTGGAFAYYLYADTPGSSNDLKSHLFNVGSGGAHNWSFIPTATGSWTVFLRDNADHTDVTSVQFLVS